MEFAPFLNPSAMARFNNAFADLFPSWTKGKRSKRGTPSSPPCDFKQDEILVAEALILLSQRAAAADAGVHSTERSLYHRGVMINNPTVQNNCSVASPSRQALGADEICRQIVKPLASDDWNLAISTTSRKFYQCAVCSECFPTGQALGGHKRKHFLGVIVRKAAGGKKCVNSFSSGVTGGASSDGGEVASLRRGLNLDLNLPPPPDN